MSRGYTPRHAQTAGDLSFAVQFNAENAETRCISRSSAILGSDIPQSNNRKDNFLWETPFIPRDRPDVKRYCRLFKATPAYISASTDAGGALAPLLRGGTRVRRWQSARRLWPDTRRLQLPLDDCCRLVLRTMPYTASSRRNRSLMTLPRGGRKVLLLAIIPVPR